MANETDKEALRGGEPNDNAWKRFDKILRLIDKIPDIQNPVDPLEWDEHGLPK